MFTPLHLRHGRFCGCKPRCRKVRGELIALQNVGQLLQESFVPSEDPPLKFFKYRLLATEQDRLRVRQIVVDSKVYFPPAKFFNDPFDLYPAFDLTAPRRVQRKDYERMSRKYQRLGRAERRMEARRVMKTSLSSKTIGITTRAIQDEHARFITESVGVLCICKKRDDILMWSHYADSHRGVCLEFDGMSKFMAHAHKVRYRQSREPIRAYHDTELQMMEKALLTKSDRWAYEDEYRLLRYRQGPGLEEFRPQNLTGIILGASMDKVTVDLVDGWIAERTEPLTLYRASISSTEYQIVINAPR